MSKDNVCMVCYGEGRISDLISGGCKDCPSCNGTGKVKQEEKKVMASDAEQRAFEHGQMSVTESNSDEIREAFKKDYPKEYFRFMDEPDIEEGYALEIYEMGYKSALNSRQPIINEAVELMGEIRDLINDYRNGDYKIDSFTTQPIDNFLNKIEKEQS
jgi:hypothetical protein